MTLSEQQKTLIRLTFREVNKHSDQTARSFYQRLFELKPELRPLFKSDIGEQGHKFMRLIALAVASLDTPDRLLPPFQALGERHVRYGAKKEDYDAVGEALLWALDQTLAYQFTAEVRDAWMVFYQTIAEIATAGVYTQ